MKGKDIMRSLRIIFVLATVLVAAIAISADREHKAGATLTQSASASRSPQSLLAPHQGSPSHDHASVVNDDHAPHHDDSHAPVPLYSAQDALAIADMHHFALLHFGIFEEHPDTFRVADQWDDSWIYRSIEISLADGHTLRLCHATHRHGHNLRYVAVWNQERGQYEAWEGVH
jgi:hypothetical protein